MSQTKPIRRIAIIGTGVIGASWSSLFLAKGLQVVATDIAPNAEAALRKFVEARDPKVIGINESDAWNHADGLTANAILVTGIAAGIGFTVALFFATAASAGPLLDQAKMGALLSFTAGLAAAGLAAVLRVGRFARAANA